MSKSDGAVLRHALLIEDSPGDARLLRLMFIEEGLSDFGVTLCGSMREGEAFLAKRRADVILLDLGLPDAQHMEAVRRVVAAAPRVPLVVLTGLDDETMAIKALSEGAQDYLVKGRVDAQMLCRSLRYAASRKVMEEALHAEKENALQARLAAERASEAKTRFLTTMSHELRTPLNSVLGYAHLLRLEGELNSMQSSRVDAMLGACTHLLLMINRVLDLSQIEAGRLQLYPVACDVRSLTRECLDFIRPAAAGKHLALSCISAPGTPDHIDADPTRLRQILLNLLGNAVKFTGSGTITLRTKPAGSCVRFEVADSGPGIKPQDRPVLFKEFERLQAGETGDVEGTGLGLSLSAHLAKLMGGSLGYCDNPGGGSIFWLTLPAAAPGVAEPAPAAPAWEDPRTPPQSLRVLVVDDVAFNRDIAGAFLRASGHEVAVAASAIEGVACAAAADYDVVMMDLRMPGMDGLEAARRIRQIAGPRGQVPIVALTAQVFTDQVEACRAAGMTDHLAKPFSPASLLDAVNRAARTSKAVKTAALPVAVS